MKTATVRLLRQSFPQVLKWLENGEEVQISKRGQIVALLTPFKKKPSKKKDAAFRAKWKARWTTDNLIKWPGKPLSEIVIESRGKY